MIFYNNSGFGREGGAEKTLGIGVPLLQVGYLLVDVLIAVILARMLGPTGQGLVTIVISLAMVAALVGGVSFSKGTAYYAKVKPESIPALTGNGMSLALLWGGALTAICGGALNTAWISNHLGLQPSFWWIVLIAIIPLLLSQYSNGLVIGLGGTGIYQMILLVRELLFLTGIIILIKIHFITSLGAAVVWVVSVVICALISLMRNLRSLEISPSLDSGLFLKTLTVGLQAHIAAIPGILRFRLEPLLIAFFLQPANVGLYSIAMVMVGLVWLFPSIISQMMLDSRGGWRSSVAARGKYAGYRLCLWSSVVTAAALALFGKKAIGGLIGTIFLPAFPVLLVLLPGAVIFSLAKLLSQDIIELNEPGYEIFIAWSSFLLNITSCLLLIPRYGLIGAAGSSSITLGLAGLLSLYFYTRLTGARLKDILSLQFSDFNMYIKSLNSR